MVKALVARANPSPRDPADNLIVRNAQHEDRVQIQLQVAEDLVELPGARLAAVGSRSLASAEDELTALARETKEEAGLDLSTLALTRGGLIRERRPVAEGYMIESVQVFDTVLPAGTAPRNEDGEVAAIETREVDDVLAAIGRGEFTLESALVTVKQFGYKLLDRPPVS